MSCGSRSVAYLLLAPLIIFALPTHGAPQPARPTCATRLPFPEGVTGKGVTIAILEFACPHPDLRNTPQRHVWHADATEDGWILKDFEAQESKPEPSHGIQVAAVAGSNGAFPGVAPDANLLIVKGDCLKTGAPLTLASQLEATIRWVIDHRDTYSVRILEMSGAPFDGEAQLEGALPWQASRLCRILEEATDKGILVVWGASGTPPFNAPSALVVGCALDGQDWEGWTLPDVRPDNATSVEGKSEPDLLAPGDWLVPLPPHLEGPFPEAFAAPATGLRYIQAKGTSFAVPYVAGVAALCLQANPGLSPADLKRLLLESAEPLPHLPATRQGRGLVHPLRAVAEARKAHPQPPSARETRAVAPEALPGLLASEDPADRAAALAALFSRASIDAALARHLLPLAKSPRPEIACAALNVLGRFPERRGDLLPLRLGTHGSPHVRSAWAQAVAAGGGPEAQEATRRLLADPDLYARIRAAVLAERAKDPALLPTLLDAMEHDKGRRVVFHYLKRAAQSCAGVRFFYSKELVREGFAQEEANLLEQWRRWDRERLPP